MLFTNNMTSKSIYLQLLQDMTYIGLDCMTVNIAETVLVNYLSGMIYQNLRSLSISSGKVIILTEPHAIVCSLNILLATSKCFKKLLYSIDLDTLWIPTWCNCGPRIVIKDNGISITDFLYV